MRLRHLALIIFLVSAITYSCGTVDLYEKVVAIPEFEWQSSYKPAFSFQIKDTSVPYQIYVVLRHNDQYNWNNIWINLYTYAPVDSTQLLVDSIVNSTRPGVDSVLNNIDSVRMVQYELPLANKERWLGTAMGDVYEHRILITPQPVYFPKPGTYKYVIEHAMREDPLKHVLNVGLRVEKKS